MSQGPTGFSHALPAKRETFTTTMVQFGTLTRIGRAAPAFFWVRDDKTGLMQLRLSLFSRLLQHIRCWKRSASQYRDFHPSSRTVQESDRYVGKNGFGKTMRLHLWRRYCRWRGGACHRSAGSPLCKGGIGQQTEAGPRSAQGSKRAQDKAAAAHRYDQDSHDLSGADGGDRRDAATAHSDAASLYSAPPAAL